MGGKVKNEFDEDMLYLGTLCKRGHEYKKTGKSLRRKVNRACIKCSNENSWKSKQKPEVKKKIGEYEQNPEVKKRRKAYRQSPEGKKKTRERQRRSYQKPEVKKRRREAAIKCLQKPEVRNKRNKNLRKYNMENCRNLEHTYIRKRIYERYGLKVSEITPEMIEIKRIEILLKRELSTMQKEIANGNSYH